MKLVSGAASADLRIDGELQTCKVEFRGGDIRAVEELDIPATHVDSAAELNRHQRAFAAFDSAEDIINGVGVRELDAAALAELNFIVHREYRSASLYEVELNGTAPYFEVAYGNDRYYSRTMGSGEAVAFHLWWTLNRVEERSVLLIEEPQAFLSFACQGSMAKHIISVIVRKKLCVIITSHSAPLITAMPRECLRFLVRGQNGMQVIADQPPPILLKSIGINPPLAAILLVEDEAARAFCRGVLERLDASLAKRVSIELRNGHGEITTTLRATSTFEGPLKFIGLYDGDSRAEVPDDVLPRSVFLPETYPSKKYFEAWSRRILRDWLKSRGTHNCRSYWRALREPTTTIE